MADLHGWWISAKDGGHESRAGRQRRGILVNLHLGEGRGEAAVIGSNQGVTGLRGSYRDRLRLRVRPGRKERHISRGG